MSKSKERIDPLEMLRELQQGLKRQAVRPNMHAYVPHTKQAIFHESTAKRKLYIGGNRSGKTTAAVVEDLYWLRGNHPNRPIPQGPIRGRVVGVDFLQGVAKILLPEFQRWCPPSILKNGSWEDSYNKEQRTLNLANGSFVEFMSYDQDTDKFAGTSRHFCHYDEEPPLHVFNECNARLVDTNGDYWISMTPVEGMSWVYDTLYVPGTEDPNSGILVIEVDMLENPYISPEAAENYLSGLSKEERAAREHGQFVQLGGLVYKTFQKTLHTRSFILPSKKWQWYVSLDHGYNNPTAVEWHAVSPDGEAITFDEHYASEMTVGEHAKVIKDKIAAHVKAGGKVPDNFIADPAIAQRQGVTGTSIQTEYALRGLYFALGNNDVSTGVAKVQQYLRINPKTNRPWWTVTENCVNLINEMGKLRWKTYSSRKMQFENNKQEQIHKKDDHAADALRYFFSFMPDLSPLQLGEVVNGDVIPSLGPTGVSLTTPHIDEIVQKMFPEPNATPWKTQQYTDVGALEYD